MRFLGYDPGGYSNHGVAAIDVNDQGEIVGSPDCNVLRDAAAVLGWVENNSGLALGVDTLMAWSLSGKRSCDEQLRRMYPKHTATIISQNSLYSSMTLNGAMVVQQSVRFGMPVFESHPKLLMKTLKVSNSATESIDFWYRQIAEVGLVRAFSAKHRDDRADAVVAAWCAAQGYLGLWTVDLFQQPNANTIPIISGASYPWFEEVSQGRA